MKRYVLRKLFDWNILLDVWTSDSPCDDFYDKMTGHFSEIFHARRRRLFYRRSNSSYIIIQFENRSVATPTLDWGLNRGITIEVFQANLERSSEKERLAGCGQIFPIIYCPRIVLHFSATCLLLELVSGLLQYDHVISATPSACSFSSSFSCSFSYSTYMYFQYSLKQNYHSPTRNHHSSQWSLFTLAFARSRLAFPQWSRVRISDSYLPCALNRK